ncbi:unnamed protein product [Diamesa serratosioi]
MTEDDLSAFPFDASENGFWNGRFLPPPPRPPLLDQKIESDGLTTCDLCSWAQKLDKTTFSLDGTITQTVGWTFTLLVVSAISAFLGAVIMIVAFKCKRLVLKPGNSSGRPVPWYRSQRNNSTESYNGSRNNMLTKNQDDNLRNNGNLNASANFTPNTSPIIGSSPNSCNSGVWTWLTKTNRRNQNPAISPQHHLQSSTTQENHYTHMEENYSVGLNQLDNLGNQNAFPENVTCIGLVQINKKNDACSTGEALYAELDHESIGSGTNPSYQNTLTYNEEVCNNDAPFVSSAPSSAYYSDLSNSNALTDRCGGGGGGGVYEIVGNNLDGTNSINSTNLVLSNRPNRLSLSAINETTIPSAPSNYV